MAIERKRREFKGSYKKYEDMNEKEKLHEDIFNADHIIEKILNSKKIRYDVLNEIIPLKYNSDTQTTIDINTHKKVENVSIYIDLNNILNSLYNPKVLETVNSFNENSRYLISSNLINMAAHFRNYFATRKQVYTNFVFFYSTKESKYEKEVYEDYCLDYYNKRMGNNPDFIIMNKLIKENLELCKILSDYLPHIYFIDSKDINPMIIPLPFISASEKNEISIIYSNDKMQILNAIRNRCYLLTSDMYNVTLYNRNDLVEYYCKDESYNNLNPALIPYMFCISGYKKYNINGWKGYAEKKTCKLFNKWIEEDKISNIKYNSEMFLNELINNVKPNEEQLEIFKRNLELFNIVIIYNKLSNTDKETVFDVNDLQDLKSLLRINKEYYELYPLMIDELLIGEEYESIS
jgi:hypothetical protein